MFMGITYICLAASIGCLAAASYNGYCTASTRRFKKKKLDKLDPEDIPNSKSKLNLYLWVSLRKSRGDSNGEIKRKCKKRLKKAEMFSFGTSAATALCSSIFGTLAFSTYSLNLDMINTSGAVMRILAEDECICYVECDEGADDGSKTSYELLFGLDEYEKLCKALSLNDNYKQELEDLRKNNASGKAQSTFIVSHLNDAAVRCYKDIVGSNSKFRSGDGKDRSKMSLTDLRGDLISLLNDNKVNGINPNCKACRNKSKLEMMMNCIGEARYIEGWSWEDIWESNDTPSSGGDNSGNNGGNTGNTGGSSSASSSSYGIQLDDGWYYWYHQSTSCTCAHNVEHGTYGRYGATLLYEPNANTPDNMAGARGCSTYSTAMAISNALHKEVTPYELLIDVMGGSFTQKDNGMWVYGGGTSYINLSVAPPIMNMSSLASRAQEHYYDDGLRAEVINLTQSNVDAMLDKGAFIVASWYHGMAWYHPNDNNAGSHFMVIRKKGDDGNYYCLNSAVGDSNASTNMTTPASWGNMSAKFVQSIGVAYYNVNPPSDDNGGGGGGDFTPGDTWYSTISVGLGSPTERFVNGGAVALYDGLPWAASSSTYFYNSKQAADDVNNYIGQVSGLGGPYIPGLDTSGSYAFGLTSGGASVNVDGVACARIAVQKSMVDRNYCDNFQSDTWRSNTVVSGSEPGYKKMCAVLKDQDSGKMYYLPCKPSDGKAHTFPGGVGQTYVMGKGWDASSKTFTVDLGDYSASIGWHPESWPENQLAQCMDTSMFWGDGHKYTIKYYISAYGINSMELYGVSSVSEYRKYDIVGFVVWP